MTYDVYDVSLRANYSINSVLRIFSKGKISCSKDDTFNGMAAINVNSGHMVINPQKISNYLNCCHNLDSDKFIRECVRNYKNYSFHSSITYSDAVLEMFLIYLTLHELGHQLYTCKDDVFTNAYYKFAESYTTPSFAHYICNVVEDCFIQKKIIISFPRLDWEQCMLLGTHIVQRLDSTEFYNSTKSSGFRIKDRLFYFILRAYNLSDHNIQSVWNWDKDMLWDFDTVNCFDNLLLIDDKNKRCEHTIFYLLPKIYGLLKSECLEKKKQEQKSNSNQSQNSNDSLSSGSNDFGFADKDSKKDSSGSSNANENISNEDEDKPDADNNNNDIDKSEDNSDNNSEDKSNDKVDSDAANDSNSSNDSSSDNESSSDTVSSSDTESSSNKEDFYSSSDNLDNSSGSSDCSDDSKSLQLSKE